MTLSMLPQIIEALSLICLGANIITMLTPTEADNKFVGKLLKILNVLSGNIGKNLNADSLKGKMK